MLQSILNTIPQRVFWKNPAGLYLGCNQAFATDAGLTSREEIVDKTGAELSWMDKSPPFAADSEGAKQTGVPVLTAEFQTKTHDGQRRWLQGSAPLQDSQQRSFGVLVVYEDVTERKRAEDAIKRSNAALSEFAHVVAHDLESPARAAKAYGQLVLRRYGGHLDTQGRDFLRNIDASLVNMRELIR